MNKKIAIPEVALTEKDWVREDLLRALRNSRLEETYFTIPEIAEIIQQVLYEEELKSLAKELLIIQK